MRNLADKPEAQAAPRSNRRILVFGVLFCIVAAIVAAWLLGLLDKVGLLS
ncbi:hypothetical protein GCM10011504_03850 [Siccirubricoccus deserti]|uniref:Uncharacterized protein n=1 Tax=Siccirubricoccus deserti TaxID=2013562 RepID=A0A9X0QVK6_9PROT|nr:hypothetical protein [Siccirubricoccus deserti]MBC4013713.1 hypothetical protein [Siccirubricoccus deserti]GGC28915.1 hypothetical protein GCM10011504_03850 [Siccirubricoccus deserti]